jgi:hypothetical protein
MKQKKIEDRFLSVPLGGRIVSHTLKWRNLHYKIIVSAPQRPAHKYSMELRKEVWDTLESQGQSLACLTTAAAYVA